MTQCELNSREDTRVAKSNWIADGWAVIDTTGVQVNMRNNEWPIDTTTTGLPATLYIQTGATIDEILVT